MCQTERRLDVDVAARFHTDQARQSTPSAWVLTILYMLFTLGRAKHI